MKFRRFALFVLLAAPWAGPAFADARDDVLVGIARCGGVTDDRAWLDCLYGAAQPMRAKLGLAPAPQAARAQQLMSAAPPPPSPPASGGFFSGILGGSEPAAVPESQFGNGPAPAIARNVTNVVSRMTAYTIDKYRIFTVTLANGQVWQQVSGDTSYADWRDPASNYVVEITHGLMGSYNLHVQGQPKGYKVRRLK